MKKYLWFLGVAMSLLIVGTAFAATMESPDREAAGVTVYRKKGTTIEALPWGLGTTTAFAKYVESTTATSATLTPQISWDNSTWISASFYDYAGGATMQTGQVLEDNSTYYGWFDDNNAIPYARFNLVGLGSSSAAQTITVTPYITGNK